MTLKEAAEKAIFVQNGCNLSGIVKTFNEILQEVLWPEARKRGKGTTWVNQHPISKLFSVKIADLSAVVLDYKEAYDEVTMMCYGLEKEENEELQKGYADSL